MGKSLRSARNMHRYLSADINYSKKRTIRSRKTTSFEEQTRKSNDKYPNIFLSQMEAIVFIFFSQRHPQIWN